MSKRQLTAFGAFEIYVGVKQHFTTRGVFWLRGKSKMPRWCNIDAFVERKDAKLFGYLAGLYTETELEGVLTANFIFDPHMHVSELLTDEAAERYKNWRVRTESLTYNFEQELIGLFERHEGRPFKPPADPPFIRDFFRGDLSPETTAILTFQLGGFTKVEDDLLWPKARVRLIKYEKFLQYPQRKIKQLLMENIQKYNK
jgi:hypothetical protein